MSRYKPSISQTVCGSAWHPASVAAVLLACGLICGQTRAEPQHPNDTEAGREAHEMSAETIFRKFASRILLLTCDETSGGGSLASGVLISSDGYIVTNAHVVEGCQSMVAMRIDSASRRSYVPLLEYYDEQSDAAILKINVRGLDSFNVSTRPARIGERVYAIGNPRGFEQSITDGIISGSRKFDDGTSWIQHSAPISPGSSGGALISGYGELLGINSRLLKESENINFAVPGVAIASALARAHAATKPVRFPQDGDAEFSTGLLYARGQGVPQDYEESAKWIRVAADKGHAEAQATLGAMYELGHGVTQSEELAVMWYQRSADQGFAWAQNRLGVKYSEGTGVLQDAAVATRWFLKAAQQGDASAQFNLAVAYFQGQGVSQDFREAYFWTKVASAGTVNGSTPEQLTEFLNHVAAHLKPDDLAETQKKAQGWIAAHSVQ